MKKLILILTIALAITQSVKAQGHFELGSFVNAFTEESYVSQINPAFNLKLSGYFLVRENLSVGLYGEIGKTSYRRFEDFSKSLGLVSFGVKLKYFLSTGESFKPYIATEIGDSFGFSDEIMRSFNPRAYLGFEVPFKNSNSSWFLETGFSFAQYGQTEFDFTQNPEEALGANSVIISTGFRIW